ncbi:hypothetical protein [Methylomonas sp. MgM2]
MQSVESAIAKHEINQLHAATCMMMTRFISGHHCPKLANVIVQQLKQLIAHPATQALPDSRDMYSQLLAHWQEVSIDLSNQRGSKRLNHLYH